MRLDLERALHVVMLAQILINPRNCVAGLHCLPDRFALGWHSQIIFEQFLSVALLI